MITGGVVRVVGATVVLVLAAALAGWAWGAWGSLRARQAEAAVEVRLALTDARARVLDARVHFAALNFVGANARLERAKRPLTWARDWLTDRGQNAWASRVTESLAYLTEAQLRGEEADLAGDGLAAQAVLTIDAVLGAVPAGWDDPW